MPSDTQEAILCALRTLICPDIQDLAAYASVTPATARKHLSPLIAQGMVHRERVQRWEGGSQRWYYFLEKEQA